MKKAEVRSEVGSILKQLGFRPSQYRWMGVELHIVIGGEFRTFRFPAGKSKRDTWREIGRMEGMVEAFGVPEPQKPAAARPNGAVRLELERTQ